MQNQVQSHSQVQHVWDSFVTHLKSLSESLHTAHDVFGHPEDDVKVSWSKSLGTHDIDYFEGYHLFRECHSQL